MFMSVAFLVQAQQSSALAPSKSKYQTNMFMDAGGFHRRHAKRQKLSCGVVIDDNNDGTEIGAPMVID